MIRKMITINCESGDIHGNCTCRVHINSELICEFEHNSFEGMSVCLQKAADAMQINEWVEFEFMNDSKGG